MKIQQNVLSLRRCHRGKDRQTEGRANGRTDGEALHMRRSFLIRTEWLNPGTVDRVRTCLYSGCQRHFIIRRHISELNNLYSHLKEVVRRGGHYMYHQFNNQHSHVLPTHCIYVFCVDLRTNSNYFPIQR
jgi:hypothetical protein